MLWVKNVNQMHMKYVVAFMARIRFTMKMQTEIAQISCKPDYSVW